MLFMLFTHCSLKSLLDKRFFHRLLEEESFSAGRGKAPLPVGKDEKRSILSLLTVLPSREDVLVHSAQKCPAKKKGGRGRKSFLFLSASWYQSQKRALVYQSQAAATHVCVWYIRALFLSAVRQGPPPMANQGPTTATQAAILPWETLASSSCLELKPTVNMMRCQTAESFPFFPLLLSFPFLSRFTPLE